MHSHQSGQLDEAQRRYQQILEVAPDHPDALHFLGMLLHQTGASESGVQYMRRSIDLKPEFAGFRLNLGAVLEALGQLEGAADAYAAAAALDPCDADAPFNLGLVHYNRGEPERALAAFQASLTINPMDPEARYNVGRALGKLGRWAAALEAYAEAAKLAPKRVAAHAGMAQALQRLGRLEDAADAYRRAVALGGNDPVLHHNLGQVLQRLGRPHDALESFRRSISLNPENLRFVAHGVRAALESNDGDSALVLARTAVDRDPESQLARRTLAEVLAVLRPARYDARTPKDFLCVWSDPELDPQPSAGALARWLLSRLPAVARASGSERLVPDLQPPALLALVGDEQSRLLLQLLLTQAINVDWELEGHLRALRAHLLSQSGLSTSASVALCAALGLQAFANEYLWEVSSDETVGLRKLRASLRESFGDLARRESDLELTTMQIEDLARASMYEPLGDCGVGPERLMPKLSASNWQETSQVADIADESWLVWCKLIERTLNEPGHEQRLGDGLPRLSEVTDSTSSKVRRQYEANPYPRWMVMPQAPTEPLGSVLERRFNRQLGRGPSGQFERILVAGCGTGFEPILLALGEPQAEIVALDLSVASLAYAERQRASAGLSNLRFMHGDLLEAGALPETFDLIVCSGVLHHLEDPMLGWRALRSVLAPGGTMRISLYSRRARRAILEIRGSLGTSGPDWNRQAMFAARRRIREAPPSDPVFVLRGSDDLFSTSAVRDLLFHACEHQFTPAEIAGCLTELELQFLGMEVSDPATSARFRARTGVDPATAGLADWEAFEVQFPDAFPAMLQFWCRASD